ncbi:MAG TPA: hypothetical protein VKU89_06565 [Solirubrobacteraceae bacterium]|nr:hypothetical protein [Solirubrobacteraceae bacterium]
MSAARSGSRSGACPQCVARMELIESLAARIEARRPNCERLAALLALPDHELLAALDATQSRGAGQEAARRSRAPQGCSR